VAVSGGALQQLLGGLAGMGLLQLSQARVGVNSNSGRGDCKRSLGL
jgi:hypothetical protein